MFFRAAVRGMGVAIGVGAVVGAGVTATSWHQLSAEAKYAQPTPPRHGHTSDPKGSCLERSTWDSNWDRRHVVAAAHDDEAPMPTATRHLILIRHGQYVLDGEGDDQRVLTELGRKQAASTGQRLAILGVPLTRIVVSSMKRARETANIIAQSIPDVAMSDPDDCLREGAPCRPEPEVVSWRPEKDYAEDGSRIEAAFRKYFHRASPAQRSDSYEVVVCHANVIRYMVMRALQLPPDAWLRISLKNASVTWVTIRPDGRVSVNCLGDAGHMPAELLTTT